MLSDGGGVSEAAGEVELAWVEPTVAAGPARVDILLDGQLVGDLDYRLCRVCRIGVIEHVRVEAAVRRRGVATRTVQAVVTAYSDYHWSTSPVHDAAARRFWGTLDWWPGVLAAPRYCWHMYEADQHTP